MQHLMPDGAVALHLLPEGAHGNAHAMVADHNLESDRNTSDGCVDSNMLIGT